MMAEVQDVSHAQKLYHPLCRQLSQAPEVGLRFRLSKCNERHSSYFERITLELTWKVIEHSVQPVRLPSLGFESATNWTVSTPIEVVECFQAAVTKQPR